jgi:hypothetical protein
MLAPTEIVEVKQGPYAGDRDKRRFEPVPASEVVLRHTALSVGAEPLQ